MYKLNGKNLSLARLIPRGKDADKRLKYLHVNNKGVTAVSPELVARVTLPDGVAQPQQSVIYPQESLDSIPMGARAPESNELVTLTGDKPAFTGPHYLVPMVDKCFPEPTETTATFTCNGELLRKLLTVACEVCNDSNKTLRLRIVDNGKALRVDTYRQPGEQEFCGVIKPIEYDGDYIPGEIPSGTPKVEKKPQQTGLLLKTSAGRKIRGEGE
jgi:hypothetical protein